MSSREKHSAKASSLSKWCDVCWQPPNFRNMTFQTCSECGVGVHNECYGICGTPEVMRAHPDWHCLACRAVGSRVTLRDEAVLGDSPNSSTENLLTVTITERPTECCLCSVDDGKEWMHAMHPIYDRAGRTARPLMLPPTRDRPLKRPAWAHTLCCYGIFTHPETKGCVFACFTDGSFLGEEDDNVEEQTENEFPTGSSLQRKDPDDHSVHHFTYSLPGGDKRTQLWSDRIREHQRFLRCCICRRTDKFASSYRIPMLCSANQPYELRRFRQRQDSASTAPPTHTKRPKTKPCSTAMHIGCAIWGRNANLELSSCRRVFYTSGQTDASGEVVHPTLIQVYCPTHALELQERMLAYAVDDDDAAGDDENRAISTTLLNYPPGSLVEPQQVIVAERTTGATLIASKNKTMYKNQSIDRKKDNDLHSGGIASIEGVTNDDGKDDQPVNKSGQSKQSNDVVPSNPDELLTKTIVNEIVDAELRGEDHCDALVKSAMAKWGDQVKRQVSNNEQFWERVYARLLERIDYSSQETNWTVNENYRSKVAVVTNFKTWDTLKVLSVGQPPVEFDKS